MIVAIENPDTDDVCALLELHIAEAHRNSPPGTVFALPVDKLTDKDVTFWTARARGKLLGFGALKALGAQEGEIKSMRTDPDHLGKGVGAAILDAIIGEARTRSYRALYLETGKTQAFAAAHRLYLRKGFIWSDAFADYEGSDFSGFMRLAL